MDLLNRSLNVKVFGVGNTGGLIVSRANASLCKYASLYCIDTNAQSLKNCTATALLIGKRFTNGEGAGGDSKLGEYAVAEDQTTLKSLLTNCDVAIITAGFGRGTGTGASVALARMAKSMGVLTILVATTPYAYEGFTVNDIAHNGLSEIKNYCNAYTIIDNDKLINEYGDMQIELAVENSIQYVSCVVKAICKSLLTKNGNNVKTFLQNAGSIFVSVGKGDDNKLTLACLQAINNPLTLQSLNNASALTVTFAQKSNDLSLDDCKQAWANALSTRALNPLNIDFSLLADSDLSNDIIVYAIGKI